MKKISFVFMISLALFLGSAATKHASADMCAGKPGLRVWSQANYAGDTATYCASSVYGTPGWWNLNVSYVGDTWNDRIRSYRLQNWPQNAYTIVFYQNGGFTGAKLTTFINHDPETNSNTCNFGTVYCEISSFKITVHP